MATARQLSIRYKRKEILKKLLKTLATSGAIIIAASSPHFAISLLNNISKRGFPTLNKKEKRNYSDVFSDLKRRGLIIITKRNNQIYVSLSEKGRKKAKQYQIDELEVKKQKKWDKKWRILIFDIPETSRLKREALRGKIKELGFQKLQKSVWVHAYPCKNELKMLREFFGFEKNHYIYLESKLIEPKTKEIKKAFDLS